MKDAVDSMSRRKLIKVLAGGLALTPFLARTAWADWPADKPIRLEIPFAAGGATDLLGRALGAGLAKELKQSVIVENRAGAGGNVGAQMVAMSAADGYTLLLASGSMFTVNQFIYKDMQYSLDSFSLIGKVASGPMVITVNANLPVHDTRELIAYVKARPGKVTFASAGVGSQTHIAGEAFADAAGIQMTHVPYKGDGPAYVDLMAGVVDVAVANINSVAPLLDSGHLRALSVTGAERSSLLPKLPTTSEDGLPGFVFTAWFALVAPAGTPQPVIARSFAAVKAAVRDPGLKHYLASQGMTATVEPADELKQDILKESAQWQALIEKKHITAG